MRVPVVNCQDPGDFFILQQDSALTQRACDTAWFH